MLNCFLDPAVISLSTRTPLDDATRRGRRLGMNASDMSCAVVTWRLSSGERYSV